MKVKNKFYVAAQPIVREELGVPPPCGLKYRGWAKPTLAEAVAHAESLIKRGDGDVHFVVQIVRVVRKREEPAEVIAVK